MPKPTSPSDFIYQRIPISLVASSRDDIIMEPKGPTRIPGTRSLPVTSAEWEAVDSGSSKSTQPRRNSMCPKTHLSINDEANVRHLSDGRHSSLTGMLPFNEASRRQGVTTSECEPIASLLLPETNHTQTYEAYSPPWLPMCANVATACFSSAIPALDVPVPCIQDFQSPLDQRPSLVASAAHSRTVSIPSSSSGRADDICAIVRAIHEICLQSTKTYLDTHRVNRLARASSPPFVHDRPIPRATGDIFRRTQLKKESSNPNHRNSNSGSGGNTHISKANNKSDGPSDVQYHHPIPPATNSLLQNISSICGMLWAGSQRDRLDVLNVERLATDNMARLLRWAETVALGDYDEWRTTDEQALWRIVEAGRDLCAWLGVPDGIQAVATLEADVMRQGFAES